MFANIKASRIAHARRLRNQQQRLAVLTQAPISSRSQTNAAQNYSTVAGLRSTTVSLQPHAKGKRHGDAVQVELQQEKPFSRSSDNPMRRNGLQLYHGGSGTAKLIETVQLQVKVNKVGRSACGVTSVALFVP